MWFGVLGPLLVHDGAGDPRPLAGTRQRTLLAALLVRANQLVPAGELAEIVWDGAPPAGAAALRTQLMRLRRSLPDEAAARIVTRGPGYAIMLDTGNWTRRSSRRGTGTPPRRCAPGGGPRPRT